MGDFWGVFSPSRLYFLRNVVACPPRSLKLHQAGARGAINICDKGEITLQTQPNARLLTLTNYYASTAY